MRKIYLGKFLLIPVALAVLVNVSLGEQAIELQFTSTENIFLDTVPIATDKETIDLKLHYTGNSVTVFGKAVEGADGVVLQLISSETPTIKVARKSKVVFFWMATKKFEVHNIPGIFLLYSDKPVQDFTDLVEGGLADRYRLQYSALRAGWEVHLASGSKSDDDMDVLFDGIIKLKEKQGMYLVNSTGVRFMDNGLFLADFDLPDAAPVGEYDINALVFKDGGLVATGQTNLIVHKVGLVNFFYDMAMHNSLLYGIMAVFIALCAGLLVNFVFRGGGGH